MLNSKTIFWNVWGHRNADEINSFLQKQSVDTDIFCLTEVVDASDLEITRNGTNLVHSNRNEENATQVDGLAQVEEVLDGEFLLKYDSATRAKWKCAETGVKFTDVGFGSILAVKNSLKVIHTDSVVLKSSIKGVKSRVLQIVVYQKNSIRYLVAHLHGVWIKENTKGDCLARIEQSMQVRENIESVSKKFEVEKLLLGGDLNLAINTKSLLLLERGFGIEEIQLRNLIKERAIQNTRTPAYREYDNVGASLHADYILVSDTLDVSALVVDEVEAASDHAALIIEYS